MKNKNEKNNLKRNKFVLNEQKGASWATNTQNTIVSLESSIRLCPARNENVRIAREKSRGIYATALTLVLVHVQLTATGATLSGVHTHVSQMLRPPEAETAATAAEAYAAQNDSDIAAIRRTLTAE